MFESIYADL